MRGRGDLLGFVILATMLGFGTVADARAATAAPPVTQAQAARRDSLRTELRRYAGIVTQMRDSLATLERGDARTRKQEQELEAAIEEITASFGDLSEELAGLDLQVFDHVIKLRDRHGGSVAIAIPENLDDHISKGLNTISKVILDELPDTVRVLPPLAGAPRAWSGTPLPPKPPRPGHSPIARWLGVEPPARKKRIIEGDLVKVRDDIFVQVDDVVRGDVVAVMGDVLVEGRIDGDLVVVLGDVQLADTAEVGGRVVTVLGRLDRADDAQVGSVVVVSPGSFLDLDFGDFSLRGGNWLSFAGWQVMFLLVVLLVVVLLAVVPAGRVENATAVLARRPAECFGLGLVVSVAGHVILTILLAVLVLTVIGIPLALLALLGALLLDLIAVGVVCMRLGGWLCGALSLTCHRGWAMTVLGMAVIHVPSFLAALVVALAGPLTGATVLAVLGATIKVVVFVLGLGALVVSRLGVRAPLPSGASLEPAPTPHA